MKALNLDEVRSRIRSGEYTKPTGGLAGGHVQTNLVILPEDYALDFLKFCVRNPKPCPILEVTDAGSPTPPVMAQHADLRTDVPKYRVYENGELVDEPTDILSYWREDLVSFLIGCSFTFERALLDAGLHRPDVRHEPGVHSLGTLRRPHGRQHAPLPGGRSAPGRRRVVPIPDDARGTGASRRPGRYRREESGGAPVRRPRLDRGGPDAHLLGLWGHPSGGGDGRQATFDDHTQPRSYVHNRPPERGVRGLKR